MTSGPCPRCGGPLIDLRGYVFSAPNLEAEGTCFRFNWYSRLPEAAGRPGDKLVNGDMFSCARNLRPHLVYA